MVRIAPEPDLRRTVARPMRRRCRVGGVSEARSRESSAPRTRWRELLPTPLAPNGGPVRKTPAWWPQTPDDSALAAAAAGGTPVLGKRCRVDGVKMVEATFLWHRRSEERRVGKECRSRWSPYH